MPGEVIAFLLLCTALFWIIAPVYWTWRDKGEAQIALLAQIKLGVYQVRLRDVRRYSNRKIQRELVKAYLDQATDRFDFNERIFNMINADVPLYRYLDYVDASNYPRR